MKPTLVAGFLVFVFIQSVTANSIAEFLSSRGFQQAGAACADFRDCEEDECCVFISSSDIFGKRQEEPLQEEGQADVEAVTTEAPAESSNSTFDLNNLDAADQLIIDHFLKLQALKEQLDKANNPFEGSGPILAQINDDESRFGIQAFLAAMKDKPTTAKNGMCRKLGQEGDTCMLSLNGHSCPCSDGFMCKESEKFGEFGAIKGLHNLRCAKFSGQ